MRPTVPIKVVGIKEAIDFSENFTKFDQPADQSDRLTIAKMGLRDAAHRAEHCVGWIWRQWLLDTPKKEITARVEPFVERGLEFRSYTRAYDYLPQHDLYLLHCAIFACHEPLMNKVVESIADSSGDKGHTPVDDTDWGELYIAAWCGMMKYWILGDKKRAVEESNLIWGAKRNGLILAAAKPLVTPWLRKDWSAFYKAQGKDFDKLWVRARKDGWTVRSETSGQLVARTDGYHEGHQWCWAHCGMALLAQRQGATVLTDPFWFPAEAFSFQASPQKPAACSESPNQLSMF